ncbi:MAG: hypothetical protein EOP83_09195 [Verrucomicrobiaceae bacterium]|nr:MAG: hypothetical protein EOP83_09195 [Verrucomicrobiaceae bacterium]
MTGRVGNIDTSTLVKPPIGHLAVVSLRSLPGSPYSQSLPLDPSLKTARESHDAFEKRVWKTKAHWHEGVMVIPGTSFTGAMIEACRKFGHQVPGRARKTYTSFFEAGVLVQGARAVLYDQNGDTVTEETIQSVDLLQSAAGKKGKLSGSRVWRRFPIVQAWTADVCFYVMDDTITQDIFEKVLTEAGMFVGIGRWRPENGGNNGRFEITKSQWI